RQTTTTNSAKPPTRPFYFNQTASAKTGAIHNVEQAGTRMLQAREQLPAIAAERLERELTSDYYEFT
ncbi:hypothetical protein, partial [Ralstonia thomasii]|uniref:hypothetical protein n=1 Tax=Ralstonia thomasii TaxID=3058596 RepID=UPI003D178964